MVRDLLVLEQSALDLPAVTEMIVTEEVVRSVLAGAGVGGLDARWSAS